MGTRLNRLTVAVLTCTHNLCFEQKYENCQRFSLENCHFYSREILVYIAWECLRNAINFNGLNTYTAPHPTLLHVRRQPVTSHMQNASRTDSGNQQLKKEANWYITSEIYKLPGIDPNRVYVYIRTGFISNTNRFDPAELFGVSPG